MHEHSSEHLLNTFKMIRLSLPFKCSPCLYVFHCSGRACCYLIHWELYWGWLLYTNCILRETERCRNCCQVLASCILTQTNSFLSSGFAKLRKVPINFVMSVCPHGTIDSYNMDIHEIWYLSIFRRCLENSSFINIWEEQWVRRPICIFYHILLGSCYNMKRCRQKL